MVNYSSDYVDTVRSLAKRGHTKHRASSNEFFKPKKYALANLSILELCDCELPDESVITGPVSLDECYAFTFNGAFEYFRESIISYMRGFERADFDSKVYISDMIDTEDKNVKYIVASVNSTDSTRIVEEFAVTPFSYMNDIMQNSVETDIVL